MTAPLESPAFNQPRVLDWWLTADLTARRALIAASLGWMLDAFDVM